MKRSIVLTSLLAAVLVLNGVVVTAQQQARILVGPNVMVTEERDGPAREHLIATHPTDPKRLVASTHVDGRFLSSGSGEVRAYSSIDGGSSWRRASLPEFAPDADHYVDPLIAYGRSGTAIFVGQVNTGSARGAFIYSSRSADGLFWEKPVTLGEPGYDHPQIVADHTGGRFGGNIYLFIGQGSVGVGKNRANPGPDLFVSRDDAKSWEGPFKIFSGEFGAQSLNPLVFTDGELFLPLFRRRKPREELRAFAYVTSRDGGRTLSPFKDLTDRDGKVLESYGLAYFAVDAGLGRFRNRLYAVWADRSSIKYGKDYLIQQKDLKNSRIWFSYSSDRGQTWEPARLIAADFRETDHQFMPSVAVNRDGVVAVSWYDTKETPVGGDRVVHRYITASLDGGGTFLPAVRVTSAPSHPESIARNVTGIGSGSYRVRGDDPSSVAYRLSFVDALTGYGDYLGLSADAEGTFHELLTDGRTGINQAWTARVKVLSGPSAPRTDLIEADVTNLVEPYVEPLRAYGVALGTVQMVVRFRNRSDRHVYGPLSVEVSAPDGAILGAANGKTGTGATMDYSRALGDFVSLPPGAISEGVAWTFKLPAGAGELPRLSFKVSGRIEKELKARAIDK